MPPKKRPSRKSRPQPGPSPKPSPRRKINYGDPSPSPSGSPDTPSVVDKPVLRKKSPKRRPGRRKGK